MPTPPTHVASHIGQTSGSVQWFSATQPKTTPAFDGLTGDVLAILLPDANDVGTENYAYTATGETVTEGVETSGGSSSDSWIQVSHVVLTADRTGMTVSANRTAGDPVPNNVVVGQFRGSQGIGATLATGLLSNTGGPSFSFTTQYDNSAIYYALVDWNAADVGYSYRSVNGSAPTEIAQQHNGVDYGVAVLLIPDAGVAGVKTLGLSSPTTGRWVGAAIEVRGGVSGPVGAILLEDGTLLFLEDTVGYLKGE